MIFNNVLVHVGLFLLVWSYQASIASNVIKSNLLVQMGTFDIGTDTTTVYSAAGTNLASKVYTINLVTARPSGYFKGLAWRNLEMDITYKTRGYIHITMKTSTQTSFSFQIDCYYGQFLSRLQFSYIAIDSSIKNFLYIQMLSIPLTTNPPVAANTYINKTLAITFPGAANYSLTKTLLYAITYQFQVPTVQDAGVYLSVTGLSQTNVNVSAYFPYPFVTVSTIKFFILYFIPGQFTTIFSPMNYFLISSGASSGPVLTYTSQIIYTTANVCGMSDQNTFIGLESFSKNDRIKYELDLTSVSVNITAFYYGYRFSMFSICTLACSNPSYPYFFKNDTKCYNVCPAKTYPNTTIPSNYKCLDCAINCLNCTSLTACTLCQTSYCLNSGLCSLTCSSNSTSNTSLTCTGTCLTCQVLASNCTSCISTTFFQNNICYYTCPIGYYGDSGTGQCQTCATDCLNCSSLTQCFQCQSPSFLYEGLCLSICPDTTYGDTNVNECLNCNGTCLDCSISAINCLSCINNTFYLNNLCYYICPIGYYGDSGTGLCQTCATDCLNCSSLTQCFQCQSPSFLYDGLCLSICPNTTYGDSSLNECLNCTGACLDCSMSAQNCTSCTSSAFYLNNICYDPCPVGYYGNSGTRLCQICATDCLNCSSLTQCFQCQSPSFLYEGLCLSICPNTTYGNTSLNECLNCTGTCLDCSMSATNCTSCIISTFYLNNQCYYACPIGYYGNSGTNLCQTCATFCLNCSSLTECYQCQNGSFLYYGLCLLICPNTTYGNTSLNECLNCTGTCLDCQNSAENCTSCITNTFYLTNQCYYFCPIGYYGNTTTGNCQTCATDCLNCSSLTECYQCQNGSFLYYGLCYRICPNTTYGNTSLNECLNCTEPCLNCQNSAENCTSCINNTFLLNNICYSPCPIRYYGNSTTGTCQHCFLNCYTCIASNICTQCLSPNYLYPNFDRCFTQCPPNYFPNKTTKACQKIYIQGCVSALYQNNKSVCLQCTISSHFRFDTSTRNCVCQSGYKLIGGVCVQTCGDGTLVNLQQCDDGNLINGDGCNTHCKTQNDFSCEAVPNGPTLTSQCAYLPQMNIQILSQTKINGQNSLKLILGINPAPPLLTADQIKRFLNIEIGNKTLNISNYILTYENGVASIQIPYTQTIEGKQINIWTNFDSSKFASSNIQSSSILEGDNVALIYSNYWKLYQNLAIFNFSFAILVCIIGVISFYKHKMIGLELILPIQIIFYSQSFYKTKAASDLLYTSLKPVSFSVLTPKQVESKANQWYRIGMTGGFQQNYNLLGVLFVFSTIFLIITMFRMQNGQRNRFKNKKGIKQWVNFGVFRKLIQGYQNVLWKGFFVFFSLSTIPLIFALLSTALTQSTNYGNLQLFDIVSQKLSYAFSLLFIFALFYTSVPKIFYFNNKNFLKKHIVKQDCQKYKYEAKYCMYFELHYLAIGIIFACLKPTLTVLYTLSAINGILFLYLIIKRPYESIIDNVGAILSNFICLYYFSTNLFIALTSNSELQSLVKTISCFLIIFLLFIQTIIAIIRYYIFYRIEQMQLENGKITSYERTFKYMRDQAFNRLTKPTIQQQEQEQMNNLMRQAKPEFANQLPIAGIFINNNSNFRLNKKSPDKVQKKEPKEANIFQHNEPQIQEASQQQKKEMKKRLRKCLLNQRINQNR